MKEDSSLKRGMVVQLSPHVDNRTFACCMMVVVEVKSWGAMGYVQSLGTREEIGGQAFYRARWEEMEYVGQSYWHIEFGEEENENTVTH